MRILTAVLKFRACRDNIRVATGAMEVRGGNGYIEDWVTRGSSATRISACCGRAPAILTRST